MGVEIVITNGQVLWILGVVFIIIGIYFVREYFNGITDPIEGVFTDMDRGIAATFWVSGAIMIFLGLNVDYDWIDVTMVKN